MRLAQRRHRANKKVTIQAIANATNRSGFNRKKFCHTNMYGTFHDASAEDASSCQTPNHGAFAPSTRRSDKTGGVMARKEIQLNPGAMHEEKGKAFANLLTSPEFASYRVIARMQPSDVQGE
jgi:hypothetical protein